MMVLRDCVRRYGRLPQTLVTDGGSNLKGTYFQCLAASFEITLKRRPKAKGRFGSVIENSFGISHRQFVYNLLGNTQLSHEDVRQVTPSHDPKRCAVWTLGPMYERLCNWAYNRHANTPHKTLFESPRSIYARTLDLTGHRHHRMISYDENFRTMTLPTTTKGTAKNNVNKGVRINNEYYYHADLDDPRLLEKDLPVKYDPYDYTIAWVFASDKWLKCLSQDHYQLRGVTEDELRIRTTERGMRNTIYSRSLAQRAESSARETMEDQKREKQLAEQLAIVRAKQREDAQIRDLINGTATQDVVGNDLPHTSSSPSEKDVPHPTVFDISQHVKTLEEYV